jgi:hypothetical protein
MNELMPRLTRSCLTIMLVMAVFLAFLVIIGGVVLVTQLGGI